MARKRALRNRPKQVEEEYKSEESASEPEDAQLGTNYSSEEDISDCELQAAFESGLLKESTVQLVAQDRRAPINKTAEMKQKLFQSKKTLPWAGTLDVTFDPKLCIDDEENDLEREATIYKQAMDAVQKAMPKIEENGIEMFRPDDYFAEMSKSDSHMQRVRTRLLDIQKDKERSENARRLREEKKFAHKAQAAALQQKQQNKKRLADAVKSHRKGMKAELQSMLSNAADLEDDERGHTGRGKNKMSRVQRNKKFGFGGQKKRSKMNNRESLNMGFGKPKGGRVQKKR